MHEPLVSIIIPTYNRAHLIGDTLDSVLAQSYTNWECLVVDDGSTDHTEDVMAQYCSKDSRFQYHHRPKDRLPGGNAARNYGFELSKGEYVNWLDSDDLIGTDKLKEQIESLVDFKLAVATCKWGMFFKGIVDANVRMNQPFYHSYSEPLNLFLAFGINGGYFPCHAYLVDREILSISGLWDENLIINQDTEFFCRVLIASKNIVYVDSVEVYYRFDGGESITKNITSKKIAGRVKSWKMVHEHLYKAYGVIDLEYIDKAKKNILSQILNYKPILRYYYASFFAKLLFKRSLIYRGYLKIKTLGYG